VPTTTISTTSTARAVSVHVHRDEPERAWDVRRPVALYRKTMAEPSENRIRPPNLAWAKQASDNLRLYLAELQTHLEKLKERGGDTRATDQLIAIVERRLRELDQVITGPQG
jgi:hypothetical protein